MITPSFKLTQNDDFLTIVIRAPYTNVKNAEVVYEDRSFLFASKPYFLRLFLPCQVIDDETGTSSYDADTGVFTITVPKCVKGEHFPNLEMLNELLCPQFPHEINARKLVEVVEPNNASENQQQQQVELTENGDELYAKQKVADVENEDPRDEICYKFGYGFGWRRHGIFAKFSGECGDLIDLKEYESTPIAERVEKCRDFDVQNFVADHYLADLFEPDDYIFPECMTFKLDCDIHLTLDDADRERLKDMPRRKLHNIGDEETRSLALSLIDLLAGYLFDLRFTDGEHNVESGWTISKLSPSLMFFVRWNTAEEAVVSFARRALVYPLIRHWDLMLKVMDDLQTTLKKGRTAILKCLLNTHKIFNQCGGGELRYLFNQLFIEDFILWIQCVDDTVLANLLSDVRKAIKQLNKASMNLDLNQLEAEARLYLLRMEELEATCANGDGPSGGSGSETPLDSDDEDEPLAMPPLPPQPIGRVRDAEEVEAKLKENDERLANLCSALRIS